MNNKYAVLIVGIILIIVGVFIYKNKSSVPSPTDIPKIEIDPTTSKPDLSNGSFNFDNEQLTFKNGKAEVKIPDTNSTETTTITDNIAYGDLNGDSKEDAAAVFLQEGGGTGVFIYVGAYVSGTVRYAGSNTVFVGDRISPQSLSIDNGVITFKYLDRKPDEPFSATPTVPASISLVYVNGELKALK